MRAPKTSPDTDKRPVLEEGAWVPAAVENHCSSNGNTSFKFFHIPFIMSLRTGGSQLGMSMISNKSAHEVRGKLPTEQRREWRKYLTSHVAVTWVWGLKA